MPEWLEGLRKAERDEHGLTDAQREGVEVQADSILLDWRPRVLYLAKRLGVTEALALEYNRLILEHQRTGAAIRQAEMHSRWLDDQREMSKRQKRVLRHIEADMAEDDDWRPDDAP